jgi:hypothetical protein
MVIKGGDIKQLTIYGREFDPKEEADFTYHLGGYKNDVKIAGNGTAQGTANRQPAYIKGEIKNDTTKGDYEFILDKNNKGVPGTVNMTLVTNDTYTGQLLPTGDMEASSKEGTIKIELTGALLEKL